MSDLIRFLFVLLVIAVQTDRQQGQLQTEYDRLHFSITDSEVHKAVSELKCGKAAGNDLLINELYICADAILLPKLTCLFNVIFKSSHFPTAWREGVIVPIKKKSNINDVENYRGITFLSTLGKLFTRIINNRLTFWSDTFNIIGDTQSGFRKSLSTVDNVFMLQSVIDSCLNTKRQLHVAFMDFKKVFDHVNRDCLWYKLLKSGIRGPIFNIINTDSNVKYSGAFSNNFECNLGVRQGESLSPFLNDIEAALESGGFRGASMSDITIRTLLYADDLLLMPDSTDLQLGIDIIYDYCTR